jgi:effector-binding domain-containing protein
MKKLLLSLGLVFGLLATGFAADPAPVFKAEIREQATFSYVCLEGKGPYSGIPALEREFLTALQASGIKPAGNEICLYLNSPFYVKPADLRWEIGYPIDNGTKATGKLKIKKFDYKKLAVAVHIGSYATTYQTINALYDWIFKNGHKTAGGPCVESYYDSPDSTVPDTQKKTEIWIPLK